MAKASLEQDMMGQSGDAWQRERDTALIVEPNSATRSALSQAFDSVGVWAEACIDMPHCAYAIEHSNSASDGGSVVAIVVAASAALPSTPTLEELLSSKTLAPPVLLTKPATLSGLADWALRQAFFGVISESATAEQLIESVAAAVEEGRRRASARHTVCDYQQRESSLSQEEHQVLEAVCEGKLNKQIAREQGVSVRTVEQRRRRVFSKMGVASAAPLAERAAVVRTLSQLHSVHSPSSRGPRGQGTPPRTTGSPPSELKTQFAYSQ